MTPYGPTPSLGQTREGRPILRDPRGGYETEKSSTVELGGQFFNIPTIYGGQRVSVPEALARLRAAGWRDPDTGRPLTPYADQLTALAAARARSGALNEDLRRAGLLTQTPGVDLWARPPGLGAPPETRPTLSDLLFSDRPSPRWR
jgi:hypothetical protein